MSAGAKGKRRWAWWTAGAATGIAIVIAGIWWLVGTKVWTDGSSLLVADSDAHLRQVLWDTPREVEEFASKDQNYEPSLSPDGAEFYFVRGKPGAGAHIYVSYRRDNAWTAAIILPNVNGPADDLGPRLTADGRFLIFYSNRPGGLGGYDIWASARAKDGWGAPFNLGPNVNSEFNEYSPNPTPDGRHLIFATNRVAARREQASAWHATVRENDNANYDLWIAGLEASTASTRPAARLTFNPAAEIPGVNSPFTQGASCMSPAGDFLYFASNRPGGLGKFDLYRSRIADDKFLPPENLGPSVNSGDNETDPFLAANGYRLYFSSDRTGDKKTYGLFNTDSREVFAKHLGHPLPKLGWSAWMMLASLVVLLPLLLFMRGWDSQRINLLTKCLLLSVLVHALFTFALSFVVLSKEVAHYVKHEMTSVTVQLNGDAQEQIATSIRGQFSPDLPGTTSAIPQSAQRMTTPAQIAHPLDVAMPVAPRQVTPQPSLARMEAPRELPQMRAPELAKPVVDPAVEAPVVKFSANSAVKQVEAAPEVTAQNPTAARVVEQAPAVAPEVSVDALPTVRPDVAQIEEVHALPRVVRPVEQRPVVAEVQQAPIEMTHAPEAKIAGKSEETPAGPANQNVTRTDVAVAREVKEVTASVGLAKPQAAQMPVEMVNAHQAVGHTPESVAVHPPTVNTEDLPVNAVFATHAVGHVNEPNLPSASADVSPTTRPVTASGNHPSDAPLPLSIAVAPVRSDGVPSAAPSIAAPLPHAIVQSASIASPKADIGALALPPVATSHRNAVEAAPIAEATEPRGSVRLSSPEPAAGLPGKQSNAPTAAPLGDTSRGAAPATRAPSDSIIAAAPQPIVRGATVSAVQPDLSVTLPDIGPRSPAPANATHHDPDAQSTLDPVLATARGRSPQAPAAVAADATSDLLTNSTPNRAAMGGAQLPSAPASKAAAVSTDVVAVAPDLSIAPIEGSLGPAHASAPATPFLRSPELRKPLVEKMGGNKQSEDAVDRGLGFLARNQENDGRWSKYVDGTPSGRRPPEAHDMAVTGLAVLAFLARDNTPDKPGPYRDAVTRGLAYLMDNQSDDGDLRGSKKLRGGTSHAANMYDQGIATLALSEAALMTHDQTYTDAALKAAGFIVSAQDPKGGGWRYVPGEAGDVSVVGWQIMALHSVEQLGFQIPAENREGAIRFMASCTRGPNHGLGTYQAQRAFTPAMTAELLFCRMLAGEKVDASALKEAADYFWANQPDPGHADPYYWYYASLSMLQMQGEGWKRWNALTRDALIGMQKQGDGPAAGSWGDGMHWNDRGGRIFATSLATLTLEVYYRYLPLHAVENGDAAQPAAEKTAR